MVSTLSSMKRTSGSTSGFQTSSSPSFRNLIINGDMSIAQRGTSIAMAAASNGGTLDQYEWIGTGACAVTITQDSDVPTMAQAGSQFKYSLKVDCTTADASIAAGDRAILRHHIEGYNMAHLGWGASGALAATLSFWVKSPKTGVHTVGFLNGPANRSFASEYTVSSANTWEKKTITVPEGDTTGSWDYTNGRGLVIVFTLMAGTTFDMTADTWAGGIGEHSTSNQVNCMDNTANNFYLTGVQFEVGSSATDFEHVPYDHQLRRCQRYFRRIGEGVAYTSIASGYSVSTVEAFCPYTFPVEMRAAPTLAISAATDFRLLHAGGAVITCSALVINVASPQSCRLRPAVASGLTANMPCTLSGINSANNALDFIAEL